MVCTLKKLHFKLRAFSPQMKPFEGHLNGEDQDSLRRAVGRFKDICESARQKGVRILVDAECTYLNEGLSALTLGAVAAFNSHAPVVWNTYQCYLKAADHRVRSEMGLIVKQLGAHFGAKMVRGAYMLQERQRALQLGLPSPVCDDYSATCINYDKIVSFLLDKTGELGPRCQFIAATHNEHSIHLVIQKAINQVMLDAKRLGHHAQSIHLQISCQDGQIQKFHNKIEPHCVETAFDVEFVRRNTVSISEEPSRKKKNTCKHSFVVAKCLG
ncbi:hydroxyproline dehydrogenase [Caerostris extrusa]|uniref:Proline dehydrogenase n=1 Tax=Caerostris extrusa TaxID=172846 RepID=A0AAV4QNP5_CAEEX|nr:hydroxyproline dehydrogenase [Caerostris extrusa]